MQSLEDKHLRKLSKLLKTSTTDSDKFLKGCNSEFVDFLCHLIHTFKKYAHPEMKKHITKVLKSKTARIAKSKMRESNNETGGGFFDFVKNAGSKISNIASNIGSHVVSTASSWFDKGTDMAKKGFQLAKPYIKEYGPTVLGKVASMTPMFGNIAEPIVKEGAKHLFNKYL